MKKDTYEKRAKIANDVMNYIYKFIYLKLTNKNFINDSCQ